MLCVLRRRSRISFGVVFFLQRQIWDVHIEDRFVGQLKQLFRAEGVGDDDDGQPVHSVLSALYMSTIHCTSIELSPGFAARQIQKLKKVGEGDRRSTMAYEKRRLKSVCGSRSVVCAYRTCSQTAAAEAENCPASCC